VMPVFYMWRHLPGKVNKGAWFSTTVDLSYGRATGNEDTLCTIEAELDSFVSCVRSVLHTMRILDPHSMVLTYLKTIVLRSPHVCTNNMSPRSSRTKYVDLKMKWLQDHLQKGDIKIHSSLRSHTLVACILMSLFWYIVA
jgi:hypothetical protein